MLDREDAATSGQWGDELDELDLGDINVSSAPVKPVAASIAPPSVVSSSSTGSFETPEKKKPVPKAKAKVAVKKLQVDDGDKWDDF